MLTPMLQHLALCTDEETRHPFLEYKPVRFVLYLRS